MFSRWIVPFIPEIQDCHPLPLTGGSMTFKNGYEAKMLAFLMET